MPQVFAIRHIARALIPCFALLSAPACVTKTAPQVSEPSAGSAAAPAATAASAPAPAADHHQHLFSPDVAAMLTSSTNTFQPVLASDVIALLDTAGIRRAAVLSVAYMYGRPSRVIENEYDKVRAENDWTAAQAKQFPERLVALCSFNPLKEYALGELRRCAKHPGLRTGIKMHIGNSDVQLENPEHLERLQRVFREANENRMAIVMHLRASISLERPYGEEQARLLLEQLLPLAPDVVVQVAHLGGTGPGFGDVPSHSVIAVLAEAMEKKDARTRNLWFDIATIVNPGIKPETAALLVQRLRQVGMNRVLYGSDAAVGNNLRPRESWEAFRQLPLTPAEFAQIAGNVAPYLR